MEAVVDTIAAIATATGPGGIGILRISGPGACQIADRLCRPRLSTVHWQTHRLRRAAVFDPHTGEPLDDGLLVVFHQPNSFTGEDVVEFQGHGGTLNLKRLFAAALAAGTRAARPGEFSERAFANGKLDLAQAEAIADFIAAGTVAAQRAARRQLSGELSFAVQSCTGFLQEALAFLEASIDFPEEVGAIDPEAVARPLFQASALLQGLLSTAQFGQRLREGITLTLTGRPNVGKSSLLNALSGTERAIVTPIPGTTRDIVEEALNIVGIPVRALDTAGIRETDDPVERLGVERARQAVDNADVIILVLDAGELLSKEEATLLAQWRNRTLVIAVNKSDTADPAALLASLPSDIPAVVTSATAGTGLAELTQAVALQVAGAAVNSESVPLVTSARHEVALRDAGDSLRRALESLQEGMPPELIAVDVHAALHALGEITGQTTREEIIAGIFSRFCIGK